MLCLFLQKPFAPIVLTQIQWGRELLLSKAPLQLSLDETWWLPRSAIHSKQPFKQWIGLRENLQETIENPQETIDCPIKYKVVLCFPVFFCLKPIHWFKDLQSCLQSCQDFSGRPFPCQPRPGPSQWHWRKVQALKISAPVAPSMLNRRQRDQRRWKSRA